MIQISNLPGDLTNEPAYLNSLPTSVLVLADISARSPRKLLMLVIIFIIKLTFTGSKYLKIVQYGYENKIIAAYH